MDTDQIVGWLDGKKEIITHGRGDEDGQSSAYLDDIDLGRLDLINELTKYIRNNNTKETKT
jgi:hypothetical protein